MQIDIDAIEIVIKGEGVIIPAKKPDCDNACGCSIVSEAVQQDAQPEE